MTVTGKNESESEMKVKIKQPKDTAEDVKRKKNKRRGTRDGAAIKIAGAAALPVALGVK